MLSFVLFKVSNMFGTSRTNAGEFTAKILNSFGNSCLKVLIYMYALQSVRQTTIQAFLCFYFFLCFKFLVIFLFPIICLSAGLWFYVEFLRLQFQSQKQCFICVDCIQKAIQANLSIGKLYKLNYVMLSPSSINLTVLLHRVLIISHLSVLTICTGLIFLMNSMI